MEYVTVVDSLPPPVVILTSLGATVEGRIRVESPEAAPGARIPLLALPADWDRSPAIGMGEVGLDVDEEGRFSWAGLNGSRLFTLLTAPQNWYLKSVLIGGQDVTDRPFDFGLEEALHENAEIVVSTAGASVEGRRPVNAASPPAPTQSSCSRSIGRTGSGRRAS